MNGWVLGLWRWKGNPAHFRIVCVCTGVLDVHTFESTLCLAPGIEFDVAVDHRALRGLPRPRLSYMSVVVIASLVLHILIVMIPSPMLPSTAPAIHGHQGLVRILAKEGYHASSLLVHNDVSMLSNPVRVHPRTYLDRPFHPDRDRRSTMTRQQPSTVAHERHESCFYLHIPRA